MDIFARRNNQWGSRVSCAQQLGHIAVGLAVLLARYHQYQMKYPENIKKAKARRMVNNAPTIVPRIVPSGDAIP